jgi:hypothetical protein
MTALINTIKQNVEHIKEKGNINTYPIDGSIFAQPFARKHIFKVDINPKRPSITGRPNRIASGLEMGYLSSRINLDLANMPIMTVINRLLDGIEACIEKGKMEREYLWMALGMAETLEDIVIKRARALRRHDLIVDADNVIRRVIGKLFAINSDDIYSA